LVRSAVGGGVIQRPLIGIVDDDESIHESLPDLLVEFGFRSKVLSSAEEFLKSDTMGEVKCLLLDVAMPAMSGLDLQKELKSRGYKFPIIFITGQQDESLRTRVIEQGAVAILFKPFSDLALQDALRKAMEGS
jgi:FixJ family two-component response regulator